MLRNLVFICLYITNYIVFQRIINYTCIFQVQSLLNFQLTVKFLPNTLNSPQLNAIKNSLPFKKKPSIFILLHLQERKKNRKIKIPGTPNKISSVFASNVEIKPLPFLSPYAKFPYPITFIRRIKQRTQANIDRGTSPRTCTRLCNVVTSPINPRYHFEPDLNRIVIFQGCLQNIPPPFLPPDAARISVRVVKFRIGAHARSQISGSQVSCTIMISRIHRSAG